MLALCNITQHCLLFFMKKRISSISNIRNATTLVSTDFFVVDSQVDSLTYKLSAEELIKATKTAAALKINTSQVPITQINFSDLNFIDISIDEETNTANIDYKGYKYELNFKANNLLWQNNQIKVLEFRNLQVTTSADGTTLIIEPVPLEQERPEIETILALPYTTTSISGKKLEIHSAGSIFIDRNWNGVLVLANPTLEVLVKDSITNTTVFTLDGSAPTVELWYSNQLNDFIVLR